MSVKIPPLYHYSAWKIKKVVQKKYYKWNEFNFKMARCPGKPFAFWVSVGMSWENWCIQNEFGKKSIKYRYKININKNHNILIINNVEDFDKFSEEYGDDFNDIIYEQFKVPDHIADKLGSRFKKLSTGNVYSEIKWKEVKKRYQGILIYPYFHQRRFLVRTAQWYYGWDCASGCIWDTKCIKGIKLMGQETHDKEIRAIKRRLSELIL